MKNISKSFGEKEVIHDLNLTLESGAFTTLLGPSGCGKTTLLRMIAGFEAPTKGEIYFGERCVYSHENQINIPPEERYLGFVFQDFALWPHLTVFENVAFGLRSRNNTTNLEDRVMNVLEKVQLAEHAQKKPGQLSGGQQQRVSFARAIVVQPDIILFDEPFSALDAILRESMRMELKALADEFGFTSVFVTHDQTEAMTMSDRIAVLSNGYLEQYDEPEKIYRHPRTSFVANFIGSSNWINYQSLYRPEDASFTPFETEYQTFETTVKGGEYLGSRYKLLLDYNDQAWTIESPAPAVSGDSVTLYVPNDAIITTESKKEELV